MNTQRVLCVLCVFVVTNLTVLSDDGQSEPAKTIDEAIKKGVVWVKTKQIQDGSWGPFGDNPLYGQGTQHQGKIGIAALALYALLVCEFPADDPVIKDGFTFIETNLKRGIHAMTYERAVVLLALEALADARAKKAKKPKAERIGFLQSNEQKLAESVVKWLEAAQSPAGGWRYGPPFPAEGGFDEDISATQFVLLGLKSATRLGFSAKKTTFLKALKYNLDQQETDGPVIKRVIQPGTSPSVRKDPTIGIREDKARGWAYLYCLGDYLDPNKDSDKSGKTAEPQETEVTGSMTTAGICSLMICQSELKGQAEYTQALRERTERGINDGLAWLETNFTVKNNPNGNRSHYYYLYGIERVGMLGNIQVMGTHNWYIEGAELLLNQQDNDGSWESPAQAEVQPRDIFDTCFALIFLKKATKPIFTPSAPK